MKKTRSSKLKGSGRQLLRHSLLDELASMAPENEQIDKGKVLQMLDEYLRAEKEAAAQQSRAEKAAANCNRLAQKIVKSWGKGMLVKDGIPYFPAVRAKGTIEIRPADPKSFHPKAIKRATLI